MPPLTRNLDKPVFPPSPLAIACLVFLAAIAFPLHLPAADWPGETWATSSPTDAGLDAAKLQAARDYALTGGGSGYIVHRGKLVMSWGDAKEVFDLKSSTKAIGVTALGLSLKDGKVKLDDPARKYHPSLGVPPEDNARTGYLDKITLRMLANQTAGFEKPGGYTRLLFEPGAKWSYSDGGPNWLAECLTLVYGRDLNELMFERVFTPIGIKAADLRWRKNSYRPAEINGIARREFGAGISADVDAMARIGYLYLRKGQWAGKEIIPETFVAAAGSTGGELAGVPVLDEKTMGTASAHYGLLWWNNADGKLAGVPRDAFWAWGLYDSLIVVVPSLDLVAARAGKSWKRLEGADHYDVLKPFLQPLCAAVGATAINEPGAAATGAFVMVTTRPSASPSPVIREIRWAPKETIVRKALDSDNWPMTWADDDAIYTAYGDGEGFEPLLPIKLSMGFARVDGPAEKFSGTNIRTPTLEAVGDGKRGRKASGMLMVGGTLYVLVRNAGNSQLGWSADRGATWTWADWKFTESFGCPAMVNFGKNYDGARDEFVYIVSPDSNSAYTRADRFVLARAAAKEIRDRSAYEFFVRLDGGRPVWSKNIADRGAVLSGPGRCYRSSVSYDAGIKRYLWCQTGAGADPRFAGGFAIYDAPEPWGPWTEAFATDRWDVGPGETQHIPAKWISPDGTTIHLVFSGGDSFSVRQGKIILRDGQK